MIVTAGAADRQAQKGDAEHLRDVVEDVLTDEAIVRAVGILGGQPVEPGGDEGIGVVRLQLVAGHLLAEETIVG